MKLTEVERTILANQYKILSIIDAENKRSAHLSAYHILQAGIEASYNEVIFLDEDGIPSKITKETYDILDMFTYLEHCINSLSEHDKETLGEQVISDLTFEGFDAKAGDHFSMLVYLFEQNSYPNFQKRKIDSHSELSLIRYRRLLKAYPGVQHEKLTKEELVDIHRKGQKV